MLSHPSNVISLAILFGLVLVAFALIETRLLPDGLPDYVRGSLGFLFIALFGYSLVAGAVYLFKLELAKTAACFVTAAALWGLYTATHVIYFFN